jgi:magnesium-protoporphyrin O-methyltransferase
MNKSFSHTRDQLETYFDKTASKAWERLTSDLPVSGVRESVRKGREQMRGILLSSLPDDLFGSRVLDAGCGTGQLAVELAKRGADVVATDISKSLIGIAEQRVPSNLAKNVKFKVADMMDPSHGKFDHIVAMDSLIHYPSEDIIETLLSLSERTSNTISFTVVPINWVLFLKLRIGKLLPKSDRSPSIAPVKSGEFIVKLGESLKSQGKGIVSSSGKVSTGFYTSEAMAISI